MINGRNSFDQPVKNHLRTYNNIKKIATGPGDDYRTWYLPDYPYFKRYYKLTAIDLSRQQYLNADLKAIQQINFTGILNRVKGATMFFIIEETKEGVLDFSKGTIIVLILFCFKITLTTQNKMLNVKLSNSQLNKFKPPIKNWTEGTVNLSS